MRLLCIFRFCLCFSFFFSGSLFSQTLSVGLLRNVEDSYRRQQILGMDFSKSSYMIRPINLSNNTNISLGDGIELSDLYKSLYKSVSGNVFVTALPVVLQQQYNTHHPYGMNDGSMILAKGYQSQLSAGFFAKAGPLSIQFRPEFVFAQNTDYTEMHEAGNGDEFIAAYIKNFYNKIDLPSRFEKGAYSKAAWGQSSIRLTFDPVSFGLSNENLWWGPGIKSSLLMTNNASGFKHLTLNASKPILTPIGSFEAQIIAGRLDPSGAPKVDDSRFGRKSANWRYISGAIITYSPKWVPSLYLGLDRTFVIDKKDLGDGFFDYFPFLSALAKSNYKLLRPGVDEEDAKKRDQYISFFARWVLPESKAEVYLQYGRNDHSATTRDLLSEPEHSRAYILGLKKLIPIRDSEQLIEFNFEAVQTQNSPTAKVREGESWYSHYQVTSGYTNRGQILAAGIGPGSNMLSFEVNWINGLKKIGLTFDRIEQGVDLYFYASKTSKIRNWKDLVFSGNFDWDFKRFVLNSELTYVYSENYQYTSQTAANFHAKLGLLYPF
jgi:hypothetical protein